MALCVLNMGTSANTFSDLSRAQKKEEHRLDVSESAWSGFNEIFIFFAGTKTGAKRVKWHNILDGTPSAYVDLGQYIEHQTRELQHVSNFEIVIISW